MNASGEPGANAQMCTPKGAAFHLVMTAEEKKSGKSSSTTRAATTSFKFSKGRRSMSWGERRRMRATPRPGRGLLGVGRSDYGLLSTRGMLVIRGAHA